MRTAALAALVVAVLAVLAGAARADSIYKYRDPRTGRDVFVSSLEQVPPEHRAGAQVVVADGVLVNSAGTATGTAAVAGGGGARPGGTVIFGDGQPEDLAQNMKRALKQAMGQDFSLRNLSRGMVVAMDTVMVRGGKAPLSATEGATLVRLMVTFLVLSLVTGVAGLVVLIILMVHAWRSDHPWWTVLMFFVNILGIVYALLHVESERRLLKFSALFCQIAPFVVGVVAAWQLRSWFVGVMSARGLM
jgi:hypothetical protein